MEKITVREKNIFNKSRLDIIAAANLSIWHGYERVIKGLGNYYASKPEQEIYFHIVGTGAELVNLKKITDELKISKYVIFHGPKDAQALDEIFNYCHVGIGSLGMHRIGLKDGATLKAREYCARGIPFIIAYEDKDFPNEVGFVLNVEPNEEPLKIPELISFYENICRDEDYILKIRRFAEENLTWESKMYKVFQGMKKL